MPAMVVPRAQTCGGALCYSPRKEQNFKVQLLLKLRHGGLVLMLFGAYASGTVFLFISFFFLHSPSPLPPPPPPLFSFPTFYFFFSHLISTLFVFHILTMAKNTTILFFWPSMAKNTAILFFWGQHCSLKQCIIHTT